VPLGTLRDRREAGGGLVWLAIDPTIEVARTYRVPGQYIGIGEGAAPATFLALAGDPGHPTWEVLVRQGGDAVDALLASEVGAAVHLTHALGAGFPLPLAEGQSLVVVATGSGYAAARPVLRARVRMGLGAQTELFLGVRRRTDVPLSGEVNEWEREGVKVVVCTSREAGATAGRVQEAILRRADAGGSPPAKLFTAGIATVAEDLRGLAPRLGMSPGDIHTNY
jgi:NAD(P)H-flavin reductase